ncbi:hypothetical protein [Nannocystis pusilla]|uniref:hypothetical protein n=1 Tax=Nannocystis pusilla TaxID=889268 RepID=UPI003B814B70
MGHLPAERRRLRGSASPPAPVPRRQGRGRAAPAVLPLLRPESHAHHRPGLHPEQRAELLQDLEVILYEDEDGQLRELR